MKINSIHIVSFGKIKDLKIDLGENLNILYGDNEAGKTHIADFIKMMFYGTAARGSGVNNLRKKYKPWEGGAMGGSIDFEKDGTLYRLEREFKASNSADTVTLHNLDLGTVQSFSGNDNLGEQIFGISLGAFTQSVFIDNSVVFEADDKGELNLKLSNLSNSTDEDISFENLLKNISSAKESLISKNRKIGPIPEINAELEQLKVARQNAIRIYAEAEKKAAEIADYEQKLHGANAQKAEIFEQLKAFELHSLKKKLTDFKTAVEIYNQTEEKLRLSSGELADAAFIENNEEKLQDLKIKEATLKEKIKDNEQETQEIAKISSLPSDDGMLETLKVKRDSIKEKLEQADESIAELTAKKTVLKSEKLNSAKKVNPTLLIIGALLLAIGIIAGIFYTYLLPFAATGLIFLVLGFTLKPKSNGNTNELEVITNSLNQQAEKKKNLSNELADAENRITELVIKKGTNDSLIKSKKEEALRSQTELIKLNAEFEKDKAAVFSAIGKFKPVFDIASADAALDELKALLDTLTSAQIRAEAAISHTGCKSTEDALKKLENTPHSLPEINDTREGLQEKFNVYGKRCTELSGEIKRLTAELKAMTHGIPNPREYERKIEELEEKLASMMFFIESSDAAIEALNDAYAEQRRSWGGVLQGRALSIFSGLTGGRYNDLSVSKDFEITVKKDTDITSHAAEYLSRGTLHQAYFALRLALSEFLCETSGSLPIILDDVFSQYDSTRTASGFEFLKEYSKNNQVLFFTCHKDFTEQDANLITLN